MMLTPVLGVLGGMIMIVRVDADCRMLCSRMEAEMTIVSEESRELADTLEEREVELLLKVRTSSRAENFSELSVNSFDDIDFSLR